MAMASSAHSVWCKVTMPDGYSLGRSHALAGDTVITCNKTGEYIAVCDVEYDCTIAEKRYAGMLLPKSLRDPSNIRNVNKVFDTFRWRFQKNEAIRHTDPQQLVTTLCAMHRMEIKL